MRRNLNSSGPVQIRMALSTDSHCHRSSALAPSEQISRTWSHAQNPVRNGKFCARGRSDGRILRSLPPIAGRIRNSPSLPSSFALCPKDRGLRCGTVLGSVFSRSMAVSTLPLHLLRPPMPVFPNANDVVHCSGHRMAWLISRTACLMTL